MSATQTPTTTPTTPPLPYFCPHEIATAQMSKNSTKSLCDVLGKEMWTNCREWGVCTLVGKPW